MTWKKNIILMLILVSLAGFYFFYEIRGSDIRQTQAVEDVRIFPGMRQQSLSEFSMDRIPRLPKDILPSAVQDSSYRLTLSQIDNQWRITEPVETECNTNAVAQLLSVFVNLKIEKTIAQSVDSMELFGLDQPAYRVKLINDGKVHQLNIGDKNPTNTGYYVNLDGSNEIVLIATDIEQFLRKKLIDYRNTVLFQEAGNEITDLKIHRAKADNPIHLAQHQTHWLMKSPIESDSDIARIKDLVKRLTSLKITQFLDDPEDLQKYGLDEPAVMLIINFINDAMTLTIGSEADPGGKTFYAQRNGNGPVFILNKDLVRVLQEEPFYFRSKTVVDLETKQIHRIKIEKKKELIDLRLGEDQNWYMRTPENIDVDNQSIESYLSAVTYLRCTGIDDSSNLSGESSQSISFYNANGDLQVSLSLYGVPEDGVGRWVKSSENESIFRISESDTKTLIPDVTTFRTRTLLHFDRHNLVQISIENDNATATIEPDGDSFKISGDLTDIPINTLEEIYWNLHHLKFHSVVSSFDSPPDPDILRKYGLDTPTLKIAVTTRNSELIELFVGNQTKDSEYYFATLSHGKIITYVEDFRLSPIFNLMQ